MSVSTAAPRKPRPDQGLDHGQEIIINCGCDGVAVVLIWMVLCTMPCTLRAATAEYGYDYGP